MNNNEIRDLLRCASWEAILDIVGIPHAVWEENQTMLRGLERRKSWYRVNSKGVIYSLCFFHKEKTPSLVYWPEWRGEREGGRFYCFGCGVGGDKLQFIQRLNRYYGYFDDDRLDDFFHRLMSQPGPGQLELFPSGGE